MLGMPGMARTVRRSGGRRWPVVVGGGGGGGGDGRRRRRFDPRGQRRDVGGRRRRCFLQTGRVEKKKKLGNEVRSYSSSKAKNYLT